MTLRRKNWNDYVISAETLARSQAFRGLRDAILNRAAIQPGERVLDLEAGTGALALPAAAEAERVWAVDISGRMCEYLTAKARSAELENIDAVVASVVSLPLVDGSVDVAISNYCLHHLSDGEKRLALAEAHRVLAPGGRLVFADMMFSLSVRDARNRHVIKTKLRALLSKGPAGVWRLVRNALRWVLRRWERPVSPEWWAQALQDAGFEDVRIETLPHEGGIACACKAPSDFDRATVRQAANSALATAL
jgi:ubiquinone/menaquinone biosynthesis C-methylase UbiE